jgi:hypothetical protein
VAEAKMTQASDGGAGRQKSAWGRMVGVFLDPRAAFEEVSAVASVPDPADPAKTKDRSQWWLPLIVVVLVSIAVTAYTVPNIVMPQQAKVIREAVMERGGTAEQAEQAIHMSGTVGLPMGIVSAALGTFIFVFVAAGLLHLLMGVVGGKGTFRHSRAVFSYALLVSALASLIKLPLIIARKTLFVETGPTLFFRNLEPSDRLYRFLSGFDIFTLWLVAILVIGYAVAYRLPARKAAIVVVGLWLLFTCLMPFLPGGGMFGAS